MTEEISRYLRLMLVLPIVMVATAAVMAWAGTSFLVLTWSLILAMTGGLWVALSILHRNTPGFVGQSSLKGRRALEIAISLLGLAIVITALFVGQVTGSWLVGCGG